MSRSLTQYISGAIFLVLCFYLWFNPAPLEFVKGYIDSMGQYGPLMYILALVAAVVFAPVAVMPLIPMAAVIFGPFVTGVLSVIGWTVGASIAFLLSRHLGRPLLEKIMNIDKIDEVAGRVPSKWHFLFIFLLRHVAPVDVLSYALGLVREVKFRVYFLATFFGVSYFSFAFAYLGEAFFSGKIYLCLEIVSVSIFLLTMIWLILRKKL